MYRPAEPAMTRLYRVRVRPDKVAKRPDWITEHHEESGWLTAERRWFVADLSELDFYTKDYGDDGEIVYVDVPTEDVEQYRVSNIVPSGNVDPKKFSGRPEHEFFVSPELAARVVPLGRNRQ